MAQPQVIQYDDAKDVTKSDTANDPAGPFSGLLCTGAGTVKVTTYMGTTISIPMVAGQELHVAVRRVWSGGTSGSYVGLRSAVNAQGT